MPKIPFLFGLFVFLSVGCNLEYLGKKGRKDKKPGRAGKRDKIRKRKVVDQLMEGEKKQFRLMYK